MTAKECLKGRRSIRKLKDQKVSEELLSDIVETASYSPSWKHSQITRYIAVDGAKKDEIADSCAQMFPNNGVIIKGAPTLMVVTYIKGRSGYERDGSFTTSKGDRWQNFDTGIASQSFCLAAYEQGLGTVILGIFDDAKVASILELPENQEVAALIAVGYPDEAPVAPKRKPVEDLLSFVH